MEILIDFIHVSKVPWPQVLSNVMYPNIGQRTVNKQNKNDAKFMSTYLMYLHSAELNVVAVTENVNTFLLV